MKRKLIVWLASAFLPVLFLVLALRPGFGFDFIPFAIHEAFFRDAMDEWAFIVSFDLALALTLFIAVYVALRKMLVSRTG